RGLGFGRGVREAHRRTAALLLQAAHLRVRRAVVWRLRLLRADVGVGALGLSPPDVRAALARARADPGLGHRRQRLATLAASRGLPPAGLRARAARADDLSRRLHRAQAGRAAE